MNSFKPINCLTKCLKWHRLTTILPWQGDIPSIDILGIVGLELDIFQKLIDKIYACLNLIKIKENKGQKGVSDTWFC